MDTIANRLLAFRESTGLHKKAFSDKTGLDPGLYGRYESGVNKPSFETLEKIANTFPKLNLNWLLTGAGDMVLGKTIVAPTAPTVGLTSGPATVAEAENVLLREQVADLKQQVAKLWTLNGISEKLGKMLSSSDAAFARLLGSGQPAAPSEMVLS